MADVSTLWADANCFVSCAANKFSIDVIKTVLLKQILLLLNPNAVVDASSLLSQGSCFICAAGNSFSLEAIQAVLLQQIQANGGTGGGGGANACLIAQSGAPVTPCTHTFGLAYDNDKNSPTAGLFWFWSAADNAWIQMSV